MYKETSSVCILLLISLHLQHQLLQICKYIHFTFLLSNARTYYIGSRALIVSTHVRNFRIISQQIHFNSNMIYLPMICTYCVCAFHDKSSLRCFAYSGMFHMFKFPSTKTDHENLTQDVFCENIVKMKF